MKKSKSSKQKEKEGENGLKRMLSMMSPKKDKKEKKEKEKEKEKEEKFEKKVSKQQLVFDDSESLKSLEKPEEKEVVEEKDVVEEMEVDEAPIGDVEEEEEEEKEEGDDDDDDDFQDFVVQPPPPKRRKLEHNAKAPLSPIVDSPHTNENEPQRSNSPAPRSPMKSDNALSPNFGNSKTHAPTPPQRDAEQRRKLLPTATILGSAIKKKAHSSFMTERDAEDSPQAPIIPRDKGLPAMARATPMKNRLRARGPDYSML